MPPYTIPIGKSGVNEAVYQNIVGEALRQVTSGPVLIPPPERIRGKAWRRYRKSI